MTQDVPNLPSVFVADFSGNLENPLKGSYNSSGTHYYDYENERQRIDIGDGAGDVFCGSIFPFRNKKCQKIYKEGKLYLNFPDEGYCCKCCKAKGAAKIYPPTFFKDAEADGSGTDEKGNSYSIYKLHSGYPKFTYEVYTESKLPKRIYLEPVANYNYELSSYKKEVSDSDFDLPDKCSKICPALSFCSIGQFV